MFKRLSLLVVAAFILGYAFVAAPRQTLAGCTLTVKITEVVAYRNAVVVTYTNPGLSSITFTASTSADEIIATKTVNPAVTGTGLTVTINLNSEKVSEGEEVGIEVAPCSFSEGIFVAAHGFSNSGEEGSSSATPPPPACGDGRINFNDCGLIAIYPVEDEGSYGITVWIVDDESIGHFGFFVSSEDLDGLPEHPETPIKIASSEDGFATLYKLSSGEYQINAGPDAEGKIFVYRFNGLPPSEYPTVTTLNS